MSQQLSMTKIPNAFIAAQNQTDQGNRSLLGFLVLVLQGKKTLLLLLLQSNQAQSVFSLYNQALNDTAHMEKLIK